MRADGDDMLDWAAGEDMLTTGRPFVEPCKRKRAPGYSMAVNTMTWRMREQVTHEQPGLFDLLLARVGGQASSMLSECCSALRAEDGLADSSSSPSSSESVGISSLSASS